MEQIIADVLRAKSKDLFGLELNDSLIQFQNTRKDIEGDLTLVIFPFVKALNSSPTEVGEKIGSILKGEIEEIESYNVVGGFLNFILSSNYWLKKLREMNERDDFGFAEPNSKPTLMVEYSSPNTNKPLHLGHLRNNFLGYSVAEILKANGHKVVKTQVINDRGIHICKSMIAWGKYSPVNDKGEKETPLNTGMKGDKLVGKYYVAFETHLKDEAITVIDDWQSEQFDGYDSAVVEEFKRLKQVQSEKSDEKTVAAIDAKITELARSNTALLIEAKEMLRQWEGRDPKVYLLWTTMNGWVYEGFDQTYVRMGVNFDKLYYESDTFSIGKDLITEGLKNGIFFKKPDGSVWIDLSDDGLDEKLVLRSDGTAVYMTQDLGTAVDRYTDFPDLNGIIYTVGNEQDYHFKVLFLILKKLGYNWAQNCYHLSYGMVELPTGKMKSREGTVVDADDLMEEVVDKATLMTKERGHIEGMTEKEKTDLYEMIALGGLKYYLLKVDPKKSMMYNPDESIELAGNTGPFIQYTHARIKSVLRKANKEYKIESVSIFDEEKEIIKHLAQFPNTIVESANNHSPALLANYSYELVKLYNHFYQSISILKEEDEKMKGMRVILSRNVAKILESSMALLGIGVPERM